MSQTSRLSAARRTAARRRRRDGTSWLVLPWLVVIGVALATLYTFFFLISTSVKTPEQFSRSSTDLPWPIDVSQLGYVWENGGIARSVGNSALVVICSVALVVLFATMGGWALAVLRFRFRRATMLFIVIMMMLSPSILLIPTFIVVRDLDLLNTYQGLILVYVSLHLPFTTYLMTSYLRTVPTELLEAASIDGAGHIRMFWSIGLPLARPVMITIATLTFLWLWNELIFGLIILQDPGKRTLMAGIAALQGQHQLPIPTLAAGVVISMIPILTVFLIFQRRIAGGLVAGSLK